MAQRRLDEFYAIKEAEPKKSLETKLLTEVTKEKEVAAPVSIEAPENLPPSYFVSATYDGKKGAVCIKLYEPVTQRIYYWYDNTGHKPTASQIFHRLNLKKLNV